MTCQLPFRRSAHIALVVSMGLLLCVPPISAADAPDPYIDRVEVKHDTIILKNGRGTELGTIVDTNGDGDLVIEGTSGRRRIDAKDILRIDYRRTLDDVVAKRGEQALKRNDFDDILLTLKWSREKGVVSAGVKLAEQVLAVKPGHIPIGKVAIELYKEQGDNAKVEALARQMVKADQHWTEGFEVVASALAADASRETELKHWLNDWIRLQPTAYQPNKYLAGIYERSGELKLAQEAYRKCWKLHKDKESALGFARLSLKRGDTDKAMEAAQELLEDPTMADEAKAIMGSAKLAVNKLDEAEELLKAAVGGTLSADSKQYATYNLGYIYLRNNKGNEARELWKNLTTPVAELALACLEHRAFDKIESLPSEGLKKLAKELNAAVGLEQGQHAMAGALDPVDSKRNLFLTYVAKVLQSVGSPQSIRDLSATSTVESLRWQAYGHIIAGRFSDCEKVIAQLPKDDGYGLAYTILIADAKKDQNKALDAYKRLSTSPNPPREWMLKTAAIFDSLNDDFKDDQFDWPEGDTPQSGWKYSAPGTGIHIHAKGGMLVFEGRQAVSQDPVSHAYMMVRQDRLKTISLALDISGISTAMGGLEIMSEKNDAGVQLAVRNDNRLAWRTVRGGGSYGEWENIALQIQGVVAKISIEYANGRVMAFMADDPLRKYPLGDGNLSDNAMLTVGIWSAADPGTDFKIAADSMQIQMRPVGTQPKSDRFGQ